MMRQWLMEQAGAARSKLKAAKAWEVLEMAGGEGLITQTMQAVLEEVGAGRNESQHGYASLPPRAAWLQILRCEDTIDKVMLQIQEGFEKLGVELVMDLPEFTDKDDHEVELP
jgi:hypothetical protein